ncbi:DUF4276 family protein [Candidatus Palauibacter sp.]|uniref:DUF4276 family protein n=1 Tax=Candidatus Palauibacter sp. TaxID=3101350 RepID=UPI003B52386B
MASRTRNRSMTPRTQRHQKRIVELVPRYQKPLHGVLAALEIGLETMRSECPHFDGWLRRLEEAVG